jgi:hypothetical protein
MQYWALPDDIDSLILLWHRRPRLPPGMSYNIGPHGVVAGIPDRLVSTVVGTCAFGLKGSDIDMGVVGFRATTDKWFLNKHTTHYLTMGTTVCEYKEIGKFSFIALPRWRADHDAKEYAHAAKIIAEMTPEAWLELKKIDKIAAYSYVGISCQDENGIYPI